MHLKHVLLLLVLIGVVVFAGYFYSNQKRQTGWREKVATISNQIDEAARDAATLKTDMFALFETLDRRRQNATNEMKRWDEIRRVSGSDRSQINGVYRDGWRLHATRLIDLQKVLVDLGEVEETTEKNFEFCRALQKIVSPAAGAAGTRPTAEQIKLASSFAGWLDASLLKGLKSVLANQNRLAAQRTKFQESDRVLGEIAALPKTSPDAWPSDLMEAELAHRAEREKSQTEIDVIVYRLTGILEKLNGALTFQKQILDTYK